MAQLFDIGDGIRVTATFTDLNGALADPSTVTFKLLDPSGVVTLPSVTHLSTGVYYGDFVATVKGTYMHRWEGTGVVQAAEEGQVSVRPSNFIG